MWENKGLSRAGRPAFVLTVAGLLFLGCQGVQQAPTETQEKDSDQAEELVETIPAPDPESAPEEPAGAEHPLTPQIKEGGTSKEKMITLHTNHGDIVVRLFTDKAPKTAENFLRYTREGHYDNTLFHRVIDGFMIQGGGFGPGMREKPTHEPIMNEADNGLRNTVGTVAMARTSDPHSATSQFFISVANTTFLDHTSKTQQGWGYCVFGKVSKGMDVVNEIKGLATASRAGHGDVPKEDVIIESVTVTEED